MYEINIFKDVLLWFAWNPFFNDAFKWFTWNPKITQNYES